MNNTLLALGGAESVALWLSVAVVAAVLIAGLAIFIAKRGAFISFVRYAAVGIVAFAAILGLIMLALLYEQSLADDIGADYAGRYSSTFTGYVLAPVCALCAACALMIILSTLYAKFNKTFLKNSVTILGVAAYTIFAVGAALINLYFADAVRYYSAIAGEYVYAIDIGEHIALWLTAPLVLLAAACGTSVFFIKREKFGAFLKRALVGAVVYAAVLGIAMLALSFAKHYSASYAEENWLARENLINYVLLPLIVLCAAVLAATISLVCVTKFRPEKVKLTSYICGAVLVVILIAAAVMIGLYYSGNIKGDEYYDGSEGGSEVNDVALYCLAAALIVIAVAGAFIFGRKDKKGFDTRTIAYAAVCIALSFALSYVGLHLPQGGSVTFASLLPLMVYSYMFGVKKGVFAGFIYGILQAIQDPWIIHPAQFLLDYPIAFSMIGFAGLFANIKKFDRMPQLRFALGAITASVLRYISHVFSGVFAFSAYAIDAGMGAWVYSLAYNSFVFADIAIVIVAGVLVFSSKNFVRFISRYNQPTVPADGTDGATEENHL